MTRDEAFKRINRELNKYTMTVKFRDVERLIDKIFDDFEIRTCKYCKHFNSFDGIDLISIDCNQYNLLCGTPINKDFYCNKFERKYDV